jgi:hypothetical protein
MTRQPHKKNFELLEKNIDCITWNTYKNNKTLDILGCTFEQLKQHIESQFEPWMSWDNMGTKIVSSPNIMWDIDHIIPLCSAKNEDDIKQLNHYTNLRPLCSYNNRFIKRGKINLAS